MQMVVLVFPWVKFVDAGAAAPAALESGPHGRLYGERRGGDDGLSFRSCGWRGAGGRRSWWWQLPDRVSEA
jgi:hypothetical protein